MFYLCGGGLAGVRTGKVLTQLPLDALKDLTGSSAGSLAAAGLAGRNLEGLVRVLESTGWPSCSVKLKTSLEKWVSETVFSADDACDGNEKRATTFRDWGESNLDNFSCFAYDCTRAKPVLFSPDETPDFSVGEVLAAAASWPPVSPSGVFINGHTYCDAEFVMSPLLLHAFLEPRRPVVVRGTSRSFADACAPHAGLSWACQIAEYHNRLMDEMVSPCMSFVAKIPGPHPLATVLCQHSLSKCPLPPTLPTIWILLSVFCGGLMKLDFRETHRQCSPSFAVAAISSSHDSGERQDRHSVSWESTERKWCFTGNEATRKRRRCRRNRKRVGTVSRGLVTENR
jgi:hypothetical protein